MRILLKALAAGLFCVALSSPAGASKLKIVPAQTAPASSVPYDTFDPANPQRHFLLCDLISTAMLQSADGSDIDFGDSRVVTKYTLNNRFLKWDPVSWYDFYRTFPERSAEVKKSGRVFGQDYGIRTAHADISGDGRREDIYQMTTRDGKPDGPIFIAGDDANLVRIIDSLQPQYIVGYQNTAFLLTRANGLVNVYHVSLNPVVQNGVSRALISQVCTLTDNRSVGGTDSGSRTAPVLQDDGVYK